MLKGKYIGIYEYGQQFLGILYLVGYIVAVCWYETPFGNCKYHWKLMVDIWTHRSIINSHAFRQTKDFSIPLYRSSIKNLNQYMIFK